MDTRGWLPPSVSLYATSIGDIGWVRGAEMPSLIGGAGRTVNNPVLARRIAICEAAERYGDMYPGPVRPITATGRELGRRALPLDEVARCSSDELRRLGCRLVLPDPNAEIRWIEGIELTSREPRFVPLTMASMLPPATRDECFWLSISTGCAIHRTQVAALLGGLYEVAERDAISVAWLRRLALPRLDPTAVSAEVDQIVSWYRDRDITVHLFDATTDVPIPSVVCVVEAPHDARVSQSIGCATGFDLSSCVLKAVLEATGLYVALTERNTTPRRYRDFTDPIDGAVYMARPSRRKAFAFLLDGLDERPSTRPGTRTFSSPEDELAHVLALFRARGMEVYAVDLTPREVKAVGYTVVQVLVPALQPASLNPGVQYRGHTRLKHDHPAAAGVQRIRDLNRWPLPLS